MGSGNLRPKKLLFTRKSNQPKLFPDRLPPSEVQQHSEHDPLDVMRLHLKRTPRRKDGGFAGATTSDEPSQVRRYGKSKQIRTKKRNYDKRFRQHAHPPPTVLPLCNQTSPRKTKRLPSTLLLQFRGWYRVWYDTFFSIVSRFALYQYLGSIK